MKNAVSSSFAGPVADSFGDSSGDFFAGSAGGVDDPAGTERFLCRVAGVECRIDGTLPASLRPALARAIAGDARAGLRAGGSRLRAGAGSARGARADTGMQSLSWQRRFEPYLIPEWSGVDRAPVRATVGKTMFASIMRELATERESSGGTVRARIETARAECLRRTMLGGLPRKRILAVFGICIEYENRAYLFSGRSFNDMTMLESYVLQWRRYLGDAVRIIGDGWLAIGTDKHGRERFVTVQPTPWNRREGWSRNVAVPLNAWCFVTPTAGGDWGMARAGGGGTVGGGIGGAVMSGIAGLAQHDACEVHHVDPAIVTDRALRNAFMPHDRIGATAALDMLDRILLLAPTYVMSLAWGRADGRNAAVAGTSADEGGALAGDAAVLAGEDAGENATHIGFETLTGLRYADRKALFAPPLAPDINPWQTQEGE